MANITISSITFASTPSVNQNVKIRYRLTSDPDVVGSYTLVTASLSVPPSGVLTTPVVISGLAEGTSYTIWITNNCGGDGNKQAVMTNTTATIWVEDTYACEQDEVFTLATQITGLSSPGLLLYDDTSARVYGVDLDSTAGHFFWFNPSTISGSSDITRFTSFNSHRVYVSAIDKEYRRLYAAGKETNGLQILDIASGGISNIDYGLDASEGTGNGYNRLGLFVIGDKIYATTAFNYGNSVTIIDRATLTVDATKNINTDIPSGSSYIKNASQFNMVNGELWIVGSQSTGSSAIGRYSADLTTLIGSISLASYSATWDNSAYWRATFFDEEKSRFYVYDFGASTLIVVNTSTNAIIYTKQITNLEGKTNSAFGFVKDPISNDLYMTGSVLNNASDGTAIPRTYLINRDTHTIKKVFPGESFFNLQRVGSSNVLWGASPGLTVWEGGSWSTDGKLLKYTR